MALKRNEVQKLSIPAIFTRKATRSGRIEMLKDEIKLLDEVLAEKRKEETEERKKTE